MTKEIMNSENNPDCVCAPDAWKQPVYLGGVCNTWFRCGTRAGVITMPEKSIKPIQFNTDMVLALLAGEKFQTRRTIKLPLGCYWLPGMEGNFLTAKDVQKNITAQRCSYGEVSDVLRVCEAWSHASHPFPLGDDIANTVFFYRADYANDPHGFNGEKSKEGKYRNWLSGACMPYQASRIWLRITNIRAELLHQITEADAQAEGAKMMHEAQLDLLSGSMAPTYKAGFKHIWEGIHGRGSWQMNPWVWVIEFKRISV